jgi:hypothetical protein
VSANLLAERPSGRFFTRPVRSIVGIAVASKANLLLHSGSLPTMFTRLHFATRTMTPHSYNRVLWTLSTSTQAAWLKAVVVTR